MPARRPTRTLHAISALALLGAAATPCFAAAPTPGPPLTIHKAAGAITLDGDLSDPGWQGVEPITTWFETRVGDNVEPQVKNLAYLTYDDGCFYAGFAFDDPNPAGIRAPLGDHDNVPSTTDYAGVIVDSRNDGKTAQMFLANPRGTQYDAISSDVTGEDDSPDFFWDATGRITATGWSLEIRIPFSSLRYEQGAAPTWGILLYRNYPRDRRYQFFTARLPRDVSCFICNSSKLTGLAGLPRGSHLVVAPFGTASQSSAPEAALGSPLHHGDVDPDGGLDLKWSPIANMAIDATVNPDFSQIESDAAQIVANERFALLFAEKRPFFLEGVDLLSTSLDAVYTRTITEPRAGLRATGRVGSTAYTVLATQDEGGGIVVLPGPQGSDQADQDFVSDVGIVRVRHDLGQSYVSLLADTREIHGGGWNRVVGPDLNWRPRPTDSFKAQYLWGETETPNRPELAAEWDGRRLSDHAAQVDWSHSTRTVDWFLAGQDIGSQFRAYNGFMPQVGYRELYFEPGYTIRPKDGFLSRVRFFTVDYADFDHEDDDVLFQRVSLGTGMDGKLNSFIRVELNRDAVRVGDRLLKRFRPRFYAEASPGRVFNFVAADAYVGEEIDLANGREGHGTTLIGSAQVRPNDHLEFRANGSWRWIDVNAGVSGRLFTAQVERLRTTWSFNSRSFLRLITQYVQTSRDTSLYTFPADRKQAFLSGSALFAYKINWQTLLYAGFGDLREYALDTDQLEPRSREWFTKVSYAFQR